jgi:hypothetical protein
MAGSKCAICRNRKGKRFCPEERSMICAPCCGNRIYNQSGCPQDCFYFKSSHNYQRGKGDIQDSTTDKDQNTESAIISLLERGIYERVKNDAYYEDQDIIQGIEREMDALEHPEKTPEVLLNRSGVIESSLKEMIKRIQSEDKARFPNERILRSLRSYARIVRRMGSSRKGGQRYVNSLKKRIADIEKKSNQEKSEGEKMTGDSLITLPFSQ